MQRTEIDRCENTPKSDRNYLFFIGIALIPPPFAVPPLAPAYRNWSSESCLAPPAVAFAFAAGAFLAAGVATAAGLARKVDAAGARLEEERATSASCVEEKGKRRNARFLRWRSRRNCSSRASRLLWSGATALSGELSVSLDDFLSTTGDEDVVVVVGEAFEPAKKVSVRCRDWGCEWERTRGSLWC